MATRRRGSKYRNRKTTVRGETFDSAGEARRFGLLRLLEKAGEISDLERQPTIPLCCGITYRPDFVYIENGVRIWEDFKGHRTDVFRLKCKLWTRFGPGVLRITKPKKSAGSLGGWSYRIEEEIEGGNEK